MWSATQPNRNQEHGHRSIHRSVSHRAFAWLLILVLLIAAVPVVFYAQSHASSTSMGGLSSTVARAETTPVVPADQFMQSIVTQDGALGWEQLCPDIQAQLPKSELIQQADAQRAAAAREGITLTVKSMGSQPRQGGGAVYVYVVTAHWPDGTIQTQTFSVMTQASGCVEDVRAQ